MAKATLRNGSNITHKWERRHVLSSGTVATTTYGFREDGVLLHKARYIPGDGSRPYSDNWRVARRGVTLEQAHNYALRNGFEKV